MRPILSMALVALTLGLSGGLPMALAQEESGFHERRRDIERRYLRATSPGEKRALLEELRKLELEERGELPPVNANASAEEVAGWVRPLAVSSALAMASHLVGDDDRLTGRELDMIAVMIGRGGITGEERDGLKELRQIYGDTMAPSTRKKLDRLIGDVAGDSSGATAEGASIPMAGGKGSIAPDGSIAATSPTPDESPDDLLVALASRPSSDPAPFSTVDARSRAILGKVAGKLAERHRALAGGESEEDETKKLESRRIRASAIALMEEAAVRAHALGDRVLTGEILEEIDATLEGEPHRRLRDFTLESRLSREEGGELPESTMAREILYPESPPYAIWFQNGQLDLRLYLDDNASPIQDYIEWFRDHLEYSYREEDGSHIFELPGGEDGEPPVVITIPPKETRYEVYEKIGDASVDIMGYGGHNGSGRHAESAHGAGLGGTGKGKLAVLMECLGKWRYKGTENLYPDMPFITTTAITDDNLDMTLLNNILWGARHGWTWREIEEETLEELEGSLGDDPEYKNKKFGGHYIFPHDRERLAAIFDRDEDGKSDADDHVFNVPTPSSSRGSWDW